MNSIGLGLSMCVRISRALAVKLRHYRAVAPVDANRPLSYGSAPWSRLGGASRELAARSSPEDRKHAASSSRRARLGARAVRNPLDHGHRLPLDRLPAADRFSHAGRPARALGADRPVAPAARALRGPP